MYNPLTLQVALIHQRNLLKEVRKDLDFKIYSPECHLFVRLGNLLIAMGLKLHKRYKPVSCVNFELFPNSIEYRKR